MDESNGKFQLALASDNQFEKLGWDPDPKDNFAWMVMGEDACVFEGHKDIGKPGYLEEYHVIVREPETNAAFVDGFDEMWASLDRDDTDQRATREFLLTKLREIS